MQKDIESGDALLVVAHLNKIQESLWDIIKSDVLYLISAFFSSRAEG